MESPYSTARYVHVHGMCMACTCMWWVGPLLLSSQPVKQVVWHSRGDYLATVVEDGETAGGCPYDVVP